MQSYAILIYLSNMYELCFLAAYILQAKPGVSHFFFAVLYRVNVRAEHLRTGATQFNSVSLILFPLNIQTV